MFYFQQTYSTVTHTVHYTYPSTHPSSLVLLMQLPDLLLHILTLLPRRRHARQRGLAGHSTHAIISTNLRTLPPSSLLLTNSSPTNRIKQISTLAGQPLQIVHNLASGQVGGRRAMGSPRGLLPVLGGLHFDSHVVFEFFVGDCLVAVGADGGVWSLALLLGARDVV